MALPKAPSSALKKLKSMSNMDLGKAIKPAAPMKSALGSVKPLKAQLDKMRKGRMSSGGKYLGK